MKILVIVVTYNAMEWIDRCFGSVYNSSIPVDLYAVDNGSTDGTQHYILSNYPNVIFYQSRNNLGFGKANNIGIKYALENNYNYVYLLNQDAWIEEDTIEQIISIQKRHIEYGILSPFQMQSDMFHIDENFIKNVCSYDSNQDLFNDLYQAKAKEIYQVTNVMASHWLLSIDCIKKVGGFSPTFPHYGEDDNYIDRAIFHGFRIGITPSLQVVHDRGKRIETKKMQIYKYYIWQLHLLSKITTSSYTFTKMVTIMLAGVLRFKSLIPLIYLGRVLLSYHKIQKNRDLSKCQGAFLSLN